MALSYIGAPLRMKLWNLLAALGKKFGMKRLEYRGQKAAEYNRNLNAQRILVNKGVVLKGFVEIGPEVNTDRIEPGVVLEYGVKIFGSDTLLRAGTTLDDGSYRNVLTGKNVVLGQGTYEDAVFLDKASVRYGSEIRSGTIYEEGANSAHVVGTKLTILGPYVTLGSFINFCDVIDMGGSALSTEDFLHFNEVGSGMIHYNFSPYGDKFSSYVGSKVPDAVFMNTPKTFLGGQARLVAPNIVEEGVAVAAGSDLRDKVTPGKLLITEGVSSRRVEVEFTPKMYGRISDKLERTIYIIGNLKTLHEWYTKVRIPSAGDDAYQIEIYQFALKQIEKHCKERIIWFDNLVENKLPCSIRMLKEKIVSGELTKEEVDKRTANIEDQQITIDAWSTVRPLFKAKASTFFNKELEKTFVDAALPLIKQSIGEGRMFINGVKELPADVVDLGQTWLHDGFNSFCNLGYATLKKE